MLGFTYEIQDMGYPLGNESWTDLLVRAADAADLTGSWWVHSETRGNSVFFLRGHVDTSTTLVARVEMADKDAGEKFAGSFYTFMTPFSSELCAAAIFPFPRVPAPPYPPLLIPGPNPSH